jgi:hypothetical protein
MITEYEIQRATEASANFKPAILTAKYHDDTDRVELETAWCIIIVDRKRIAELRQLSPTDLATISISAVGLHVDSADIDINSAGLIADLSKQLTAEVATSF